MTEKSDIANRWHILGQRWMAMERYGFAAQCFIMALSDKPDHVEAMVSLGNCYRLLGETEMAIGTCQDSIRLDRENAVSWYQLGLAMAATGNHDDAIIYYLEALRIDPKHAAASFSLGVSLEFKENTEAAMKYYERAVAEDPALVESWLNMSAIYRRWGDFTKASECGARAFNPPQQQKGRRWFW